MSPCLARRPQAAYDGATEGGRLKSFRSPDQLVNIYRASQAGVPTKKIAQDEGIPYGSVSTALHQLNKYLKGKDRGQTKRSSAYIQAVKLIRQEKRKEPTQTTTAPQNTPQGDNFTFLKASFDKFQHGLSTFIEVEVNSQLTALKEENQVLREELRALRRENERLRKDTPRTIDWVDILEHTLAEK